jgi:WhiB family redox-sensing transcriptional regulator
MNKHAGIHPQPSPWRQPHGRGQPERVSPWRDPDERVFLSAFWPWRLHAACRGVDTELFYSPEGERGLARTSCERAAKAIYAACLVKALCARYAVQHHERYGVWGGADGERTRLPVEPGSGRGPLGRA